MHRRNFLKSGAVVAGVSFAGILSWPRRSSAATIQYDVLAERVLRPPLQSLRDPVPFWQLSDQRTAMPLLLEGLTGDTLVVNLSNSLDVPIRIDIPGLGINLPICRSGESVSFTVSLPPVPGNYVFFDVENASYGRAMGLSGALLVRANDGSATLVDNGVVFDREHILLLQEYDTRLNLSVDSGVSYNFLDYEPDYFYVNNTAYVTGNDNVKLQMLAGENVAIRFVNAGLIYYPMHFHGYHVSVVTRNRSLVNDIIEKDTVAVRPGEVVDTILSVEQQTGLYPLHSHFVPAVTNNGVYPGGGLIILDAS